jgi:hypothetical protein
MRVMLRKVTKTPLDFEIKSNEITFKGYLEYHEGKLILLHARLFGYLPKECDICAETFRLYLDEEVSLFINDGLYTKDESDINLDVIESFDGFADIDEILHSEIELIKSDYHSCESCQGSDIELTF